MAVADQVVLTKDEEVRNLRSLAEKLKGADVELSKTSAERHAWDQAGEFAGQLAS